MKLKLSTLEWIFSVFALLHVSDVLAFRSAFYGSEGIDLAVIASPIDPVMGGTRYLIFLISASLLILYWKTASSTILKNPFLWILVLIAALSISWSTDPPLTQRAVLMLSGWSLFGTYLAVRYTLRGQIKIVSAALVIIMLITVGFAAAFPAYGFDAGVHQGALRGAFWHKNTLGFFMCLSSCLFFVNSVCSAGKERAFWRVLNLLAIVLLLLSTSISALVVTFVTLLALTFYKTFRWDGRLFVAIFCMTILALGSIVSLLQGNFEIAVTTLGRDASLSGRTDIWLAVVDKVSERPLLGYGVGGFWSKHGPAIEVWKTIGFTPSKSHNGFVDLAAELGLVGVAIFCFSFFSTFGRAIQWAKTDKELYSFWPLIYLTIFLLQNQTEGPIIGGFTWVIYLAVSLSLGPATNEKRLLRHSDNGNFNAKAMSSSLN